MRVADVATALLLALLAVHIEGVAADAASAIRYPFELDYGEGLIWEQADHIPGPAAYAIHPALPFIVYNYPPLYYLFVHAAQVLVPDPLAAGRLVSTLSAFLLAPLVAAVVLLATPGPRTLRTGLVAASAGLLVPCLHAVRSLAMVMRVDMPGLALCIAAIALAAWADGRWRGTTIALLLCVAAVFTKQTFLSAGAAIAVVALLRRPRDGAVAVGIAATTGLAVLLALQWLTAGGFLQNILGYNLVRVGGQYAAAVFAPERASAPFAALMLVAAIALVPGLRHIRTPGRCHAARAILLLAFVFATFVLCATSLKSGGNFYYTMEWLTLGAALLGTWLNDLWQRRAVAAEGLVTALLAASLAIQPLRQWDILVEPGDAATQQALTDRIAAAGKPVASENLTLLKRAGRPVLYEPFIATELAAVGRWDEAPLVDMFRTHAFAFVITLGNLPDGGQLRSPAVDAAMRAAYPKTTPAGADLWLRTSE